MEKKEMEGMMKKAHGGYDGSVMMANQGATAFLSGASKFPAQNPITKSGKKVMESMKEQYGERGKEVFYKSINKGVKGSRKWHK